MYEIPMNWFLILAAALFSIGLYGVLARKNAIMILMGIELMLNAVNINLVTFWRFNYMSPTDVTGQVFAVIVFAVAAAEVAVGLALVISLYRRRNSIAADEIDLMKW